MPSRLKVGSVKSSRGLAILVLLMLLGSGCAGPDIPLEVGVKEYPTDVILGAQPEAVPPPPPSENLTPGFPGFVQPPPPIRELPPQPISVPCPKAHPFDGPVVPARNRATNAPESATYKFRNNGTFSVTNTSTGAVTKGAYPVESERKVFNPVATSMGFSFQVEIPQGDRTTTTQYSVTPESQVSGQAGLFIRQIVTRLPDGSGDSFDPVGPGLKLLEFPAEGGKAWDTAGTDPTDGTAMMFHARIGIEIPDGDDVNTDPDIQAKIKIDACGEPLDAWLVEVTAGRIIRPGRDLNFSALYAVATQFGGLIIYDNVCLGGIEGDTRRSSCNEATISSVPKLPR